MTTPAPCSTVSSPRRPTQRTGAVRDRHLPRLRAPRRRGGPGPPDAGARARQQALRRRRVGPVGTGRPHPARALPGVRSRLERGVRAGPRALRRGLRELAAPLRGLHRLRRPARRPPGRAVRPARPHARRDRQRAGRLPAPAVPAGRQPRDRLRPQLRRGRRDGRRRVAGVLRAVPVPDRGNRPRRRLRLRPPRARAPGRPTRGALAPCAAASATGTAASTSRSPTAATSSRPPPCGTSSTSTRRTSRRPRSPACSPRPGSACSRWTPTSAGSSSHADGGTRGDRRSPARRRATTSWRTARVVRRPGRRGGVELGQTSSARPATGAGGSSSWGAGSKGATFLNIVPAAREAVAAIVDVNPRKHGRLRARVGARGGRRRRPCATSRRTSCWS